MGANLLFYVTVASLIMPSIIVSLGIGLQFRLLDTGIKSLLKKAPDALVIPVYIHQTWALNRYGKFPMSVGERIGWTVLPAIDPRGKNANEVAQLAEESVRREYEAQRNQT